VCREDNIQSISPWDSRPKYLDAECPKQLRLIGRTSKCDVTVWSHYDQSEIAYDGIGRVRVTIQVGRSVVHEQTSDSPECRTGRLQHRL
jgi:hypothetical protein